MSTRKIKKKLRRQTYILPKIKKSIGEIAHNREEIRREVTHFYARLYADPRIPQENINKDTRKWEVRASCNGEVPRILEVEVSKAMKNLKVDKATMPEDEETESLKILGRLTDIFNEILDTGTTPEQWTTSEIIYQFNINNLQNLYENSKRQNLFNPR